MTQFQTTKFALVIPTLNEAGNIRTVLDRACAALVNIYCDWEIVVVDDDSDDGTQDVVAEYVRKHDCVRLVTRRGERGLAGAIIYGWSQTDANLLGVMDADLQHPPELLPELIDAMSDRTDIAIASRYIRPHAMDGWSPIRKLISRVSVLASIPVQRRETRVRDPLSGFFVVKRDCIAGLEFQKTGFKLLLEILARGRIEIVQEVPFTFSRRIRDRSKAGWKTGVDYASLLCKLLRRTDLPERSRASSRTESEDSRSPRSLQIILGLLPLVLGLQLIIWTAYLPTALRGDADFRSMYTGGALVKSGRAHQLYNYVLQKKVEDQGVSERPALLPYNHLPYEALLFVGLALLSYKSAYLCWLGINIVLAVNCHWRLRRRLWQLDQLWHWFPLFFVLGFMPLAATLMQGQDSVLTLLLFSSALISLEDRRDWFAGLLIGLAFYKFQLVLPMALLFLVWHKWRLVAGIATSIAATLLLSIVLSGWEQIVVYVHSMRHLSTAFPAGTSVLQIMPAARMPNLRGVVHAIPQLPSGVAFAMILFLSVAVVVVSAWAGRRASAQWQFAIAVSATTLVGYHVLMHDLSILLVALAVLLDDTDTQAFWSVPLVWLAPIFCFFAYDYIAAVALIAFFFVLIRRTRRKFAFGLTPNATSPYAAAIRSV